MKFLLLFPFLWVNFALLDPDPNPATQINADPDPHPCLQAHPLRPAELLNHAPQYREVPRENEPSSGLGTSQIRIRQAQTEFVNEPVIHRLWI
jgi:hypothetical protein